MAWNVIVAGAGFAGMNAARELEKLLPRQSTRLTVVNDVNFILYTPFLPEAASGTLEPRHVVTPLRDVLRRAHLRLGAVTDHDPDAQTVEVTSHAGEVTTLEYDQLIIAIGSVSRSLDIPGLSEHAVGFKSLADAIYLRNHVIATLEEANATEDAERRTKLLSYVFVGGGYAGLEALAELQDFAAEAMNRYPRARLHGMRWLLVEAADRVMGQIDEQLGDYSMQLLRSRGIEFHLETTLDEVTADSVTLSTGETVPTNTVCWTAGVAPHPSLEHLSLPLNERGYVPVDDHLRVEGMSNVFAVGDCARVPAAEGGYCPPTAQHGIRQGRVAGRNVAAALGVGSAKPFAYKSKGMFATLGMYKGVGVTMGYKFSGVLAWWMARSYHMSQLPGLARKVRAIADWTIGLPFPRDVSEIGSLGHPGPLSASAYRQGGSHRPLAEMPAEVPLRGD